VPYWEDEPSTDEWIDSVKSALTLPDASYGIYIHIPFCETLCTYCGCNNTITKNHDKELPYVDTLLREWQMYLERVPMLAEVPLKQVHLGGGTPTFLSPSHLKKLVQGISQITNIDLNDFEGAIEVDPRRTSEEQLSTLRELGFNRISLGVQDFDPDVQQMVRRIQPFEQTKTLTETARKLGYDSVNFDLIYGLPGQTIESITKSAELTASLRPDRIALYSLAIVPWIKPAQRSFKDEDLPQGNDKRALYDQAKQVLLSAGYKEIGMDHFALADDALFKAYDEQKLHRNFMGYTDQRADVLIGLGVSAISESPTCFHQNEKVLPVYERRVNEQRELPTLRGHLLNGEDRLIREQILAFMTRFQVELNGDQEADYKQYLQQMIDDKLVTVANNTLTLTEKGRPFLRNACMALDKRMRQSHPQDQVFSKSL
tara:strand:+ start:2278 stop:3564 length:1287 start_codon:yes stop_codon:yes gene_type:complete